MVCIDNYDDYDDDGWIDEEVCSKQPKDPFYQALQWSEDEIKKYDEFMLFLAEIGDFPLSMKYDAKR